MVEPSLASEAVVDDDYDSEVEEEVLEKAPKLELMVNYEAKLRELLHRLNSIEIKLCSDAAKEFIKLLKGDSGGEFLRHYVTSSSRCSELLTAWKLRQGKPGISYVFKLISVVLGHPEGRYRPNNKEGIAISRVLDKFARSIIEEHLQDVYRELNGREYKSQNAALMLMASVVRRGSVLASDFAKSFDFKLKGFAKLAGFKKNRNDKRVKRSSRKAFVGFAMSFLEAGKPGLLRWVLQQKEMYSGVLRALGNDDVDDDETVVYVLSTLRDRVLVEESLVPPGLRSVLFGSATLEQLVEISGRENGGDAAELAYHVLLLVCTDPSNGLMPDLTRRPNPLRGNPRRLLGLMKKLKATKIVYHRDLLLAIVSGRPFLGGLYMEEFPYNLEDYASANWMSFVTLAANLVSSVAKGLTFDSLVSHPHDLHLSDGVSVQNIMKCVFPRSFSQSAIKKGLLQSDFLVKHGTLRLLLEGLKLLDSLIAALNSQRSFYSTDIVQARESLKQEIQNEVRTLLPSPQVLLTQLSSLSSQSKTRERSLKRKALENGRDSGKKLKRDTVNNEDTDIIISGISSTDLACYDDTERVGSTTKSDDFDAGKDIENVLQEIWGPNFCKNAHFVAKDTEIYFQSQLLSTLKYYFKIMPGELEGFFDFLTKLQTDSLALPANLQRSLLSLLVEYVGWSPTGFPVRAPPGMYKHLQSFINLLIFSPVNDIRNQAYDLAQAAMLSTGAFDRNHDEIGSWFLFLPGYDGRKSSFHVPGVESLQSLCQVVISFLCDAVSTTSNSLFKYWDIVRSFTLNLKVHKDISPDFSPLVVCILQKCLRLLTSESETFKLPEKSMISLYVANTLKFILQTQVDARLLASVVDSILFERLGEPSSVVNDSEVAFCEWRPLKNLLLFSRTILHQQPCLFAIDKNTMQRGSSFKMALSEAKSSLRSGNHGEIVKGLFSSIICTMPEEIVKNFPSIMSISQKLPGITACLMPSIFFLQQTLLTSVSNNCPKVFLPGLEMSLYVHKDGEDDACVVGQTTCDIDLDTNGNGSAAATFGFFLKEAPFHVLFPSVMSTVGPYSSEPVKIKDLLLAKLSQWKSYSRARSNLHLLLFWLHQLQSSYRISPSPKLQELSEICFILVKDLLVQLLDSNARVASPGTLRGLLSAQEFLDVAETIFCHPLVVTSISCPLNCDKGLEKTVLVTDMDNLVDLSRQSIHPIDHHVLDILVTTTDFLFSLGEDHRLEANAKNGAFEKLVKVFDVLIQRVFMEVKKRFEKYIRTGDMMLLFPQYYVLHLLVQFISPFQLLGLVKWMFKDGEIDRWTVQESNETSTISFGCYVAVGAFRNLSSYLMQPLSKRRKYDMFWAVEENKDANIVEEIYIQMTQLALQFENDYPYFCLLEAVNAAHRLKYKQHHSFHRLSLMMSRVIMNTSVELISHCINRTNKAKAKLLFLLTDMSSLHLSVFGDLFLDIVSKDLCHRGNKDKQSFDIKSSDEDYLMLLPAALLYFNSTYMKFGVQYYQNFRSIPSFYSTILLKGFQNWKSFVSSEIFEEEYGSFVPSSCQELLGLVNDSLLGKAICMLQHHFALDGDLTKMKKRLKLFSSIFPLSRARNELIDPDFGAVDSYSFNQSLNLINRVIGKISFCRTLLFPNCYQIQSIQKQDEGPKETPVKMASTGEEESRIHFVKILVDIWQVIVKKFPVVSDSSKRSRDVFLVYGYLETFVLRSILELTTEIHGSLVQLESIPFLEQLMKSALRYRYEDPSTLKMLQGILTVLSEGKFSRDLYLQLLLAHSQFKSTIQSVSNSTNCSHIGAFSRPMPGTLRYLVLRTTDRNTSDGNSEVEIAGLYSKQLEVIKLLRILFLSKSNQSALDFGKSLGIQFRELHLLLLSSYGATLSQVDLEIYNLISSIESIEGIEAENLAGYDCLWGNAASKIEKERVLECNTANIINDAEAVKERHRSQFRENLPIDPKICVSTVLYFPYYRTASPEPTSLDKLQSDNSAFILVNAQTNPERYDPVFILRFSLYCLSVGYIEPMEFASLGLLAIALVSMSSPDEGIRILAYNTLEKYKNALEQCRKRKDVTQIRLLLTSLQNGIEESWQRIPSIVAIFAAEASFVLLDSSHDHYATLSRLLMNSSKLNMKNVPMFNDFFWSVSVNFKAERRWILRLLYAGLNFDDDAQIYIRNSILETLMTFYFSPLSDNESNDLIIQIVKKSIKSYKLTRHLVENCGLFPWLSSALVISNKMNSREEKNAFILQLTMVSEVVSDVIFFRNITEWLQKEALEQLMALTSHLYRFLVDGVVLVDEQPKLADFILEIMTSTLKISQKRKIYQPHFNLSIDGLYKICEVTGKNDDAVTCASAEFGLKAVLMSTPPAAIFYMGREKLQAFLTWAISSALRAESAKFLQNKASQNCLSVVSELEQQENSLVLKLLRWLIASVILGKLATRSNEWDLNTSSSLKDLLHLVEHTNVTCEEKSRNIVDCEEFLASTIIFLQQLVPTNYKILPAVVSSLSILLHNAFSSDFQPGHVFRCLLESLCSKIRCPAEANPSWRWSFYQSWKDFALELTDSQKIDELHASQSLLFTMSNVLQTTRSGSLQSLTDEVRKISAFEWEKRILTTQEQSCNMK